MSQTIGCSMSGLQGLSVAEAKVRAKEQIPLLQQRRPPFGGIKLVNWHTCISMLSNVRLLQADVLRAERDERYSCIPYLFKCEP